MRIKKSTLHYVPFVPFVAFAAVFSLDSAAFSPLSAAFPVVSPPVPASVAFPLAWTVAAGSAAAAAVVPVA